MKDTLFPTIREIVAAKRRIRPHVRHTPLEALPDDSTGTQLWLKLENWQHTGSFKIRGAMNRLALLSAEEASAGVITASAGNHGLGVAAAAQLLEISAMIVVPESAAPAKVAALRRYPVQLLQHGQDYDDAEIRAHEMARELGLTFVHAFDDPQVIAGQGTIALEILADLPEVARVVVPVGGGGLISGIGLAARSMNPQIEVIGVQPQASPAMVRALEQGKVVETPIEPTLADGLAGRFVSDLTLALCQRYVDRVVTVSEKAIREALVDFLRRAHMMVEPSAAVGLAALLNGEVKPAGGPTVLVVTGRNLDVDVIVEVLRPA